MTARALVVPALLAAAALAATVDDASACSCVQGDPRTLLRQADAAFVGRLVEKRESRRPLRSSADPATYVFRVDRVVKGRLGGTVEVLAATSGASCGIEAERGKPVGLFLDRANGEWRSSLCQQIEPARLRAAARPLPAPNGRGPAALVVGGRFGPARTLALDAQGRTLAYGRGEGESLILSVCPGGRRVAELVRREGSDAVAVAVRALPTLRTVWERRLATPAYTHATALSCRTPGGRRVLAFTGNVDFAARAPRPRGAGLLVDALAWDGHRRVVRRPSRVRAGRAPRR